jgi:cobaltochelatase CobN
LHRIASPDGVEEVPAFVDLGQSPGDIAVLSAADTDLGCLAAAARLRADGAPSLRLAHLLRLGHPAAIDLHAERVLAHARLVVVRLLGGIGYWRYGVDRLSAMAREGGPMLALLAGDGREDPELARLSTIAPDALARLAACLDAGGVDNAGRFLEVAADAIAGRIPTATATPLPRVGPFGAGDHPGPTVAILFYRALALAGTTAPVSALADGLAAAGLSPDPIFLPGLKDAEARAFLAERFARRPPDAIVNLTGFAVADPTGDHPVDRADVAVFQAVIAGGARADWTAGARGLGPRDLIMAIGLPELDGRLAGPAIGFKEPAGRDPATECDLVTLVADPEGVAETVARVAAQVRLRHTAPSGRRVAVMVGSYPTREGRLGNGVGIDTPASVAAVLALLAEAGYATGAARPRDGREVMARFGRGPTPAHPTRRPRLTWPVAAYRAAFAALPDAARAAVTARWGAPEDDPSVVAGADGPAFALPGFQVGAQLVLAQPSRGYDVDPGISRHDPALVPPHGYLAVYLFLRHGFDAHAIVHVGKHGTLEWLPGKATALSAACWPRALAGGLPVVYPFIVNDPGEGTQAKRRLGAVVVDHLTPPFAKGGGDPELARLERLIDEWHEAARLDPRRTEPLLAEIRDRVRRGGLGLDLGVDPDAPPDQWLGPLDAFICRLKETQIRDGLHVFGEAIDPMRADRTVAALVRAPRGAAMGDMALTAALAADLGLDPDPAGSDLAEAWTGPRPPALEDVAGDPWRSTGDTVERLEALALDLVAGRRTADESWHRTRAVLARVATTVRPALMASPAAERAALLAALDGRRVAPGPSGAPTRGRVDVLPTGRNFHALDARGMPTPTAWALAWRSTQLLVEAHAQETGDWPRRMAITAWGTSAMRTGGDDTAQVLALLGVRPVWEPGTGRVVDLEVMPPGLLDRPRVDVTVRISGFFRDAFPGLVALMDRAVRLVAGLDEPADVNPLAAAVAEDRARSIAAGLDPASASARAAARVWGAKPGSYGAGLHVPIDEGAWRTTEELAEVFLDWSQWAYVGDGDGGIAEGAADRAGLARQLGRLDAVVHAQDNREHDILDSDDYWQFAGGLTVAARVLSGRTPAVWHLDHSHPERPSPAPLAREIARVLRGRAINPTWIAGVKRHGWKGAIEMAATVDYLFAFQATTGLVADHHFELLADAYLGDPDTDAFLRDANPAARDEMRRRFQEAIDRGLWRPRSNRLVDLIHGREARAA